MYTYIHTCMHTHIHAYTYIHTYTHTYKHNYIHTYITLQNWMHCPEATTCPDMNVCNTYNQLRKLTHDVIVQVLECMCTGRLFVSERPMPQALYPQLMLYRGSRDTKAPVADACRQLGRINLNFQNCSPSRLCGCVLTVSTGRW